MIFPGRIAAGVRLEIASEFTPAVESASAFRFEKNH